MDELGRAQHSYGIDPHAGQLEIEWRCFDDLWINSVIPAKAGIHTQRRSG